MNATGEDGEGRDLATLRAEYLAYLDVQHRAYLDFRDSLDAAADVFRVIRAQVERDSKVRDLGGFIDPKPLRAALTAGLTEFERTRRVGQGMLFRLLLAEGATVEDICRAWDLPREVVELVIADESA